MSDSEQYLQSLCQRTFLGLWTYPNPFFNSTNSQNGNEDELCDAIVVFGRRILIFSDKVAKLDLEKNARVGWNRWYRKAVLRSMRQLAGAERVITTHPSRVFSDRRCTQRLLPEDVSDFEIHRIVVVRGASEASKKYFGGGVGSLGVSTVSDPLARNEADQILFVNPYDDKRRFFHVFNDQVLEIALGELDTITDFVDYLTSKENLFRRREVIAAGEEDILAYYLKETNAEGIHDFVEPADFDSDGVIFPENAYARRITNDQYRMMRLANEDSYFVDWWLSGLCDSLDGTYLRETLEPSIRDIASLSRIERRFIGSKFIDAIKTTPKGAYRFSGGSGLFAKENPLIAIVLNLPQFSIDDTRSIAFAILEGYVSKFIDFGLISWDRWNCILFDRPRFDSTGQVSLLCVDRLDMHGDRLSRARAVAAELGLVSKMDFTRVTEKEYPDIADDGSAVSRNVVTEGIGPEGLMRLVESFDADPVKPRRRA